MGLATALVEMGSAFRIHRTVLERATRSSGIKKYFSENSPRFYRYWAPRPNIVNNGTTNDASRVLSPPLRQFEDKGHWVRDIHPGRRRATARPAEYRWCVARSSRWPCLRSTRQTSRRKAS